MNKRATLVVLAALLIAGASSASAQIFSANFNYTAGDSLTGQGWLISSGGTTNTIKIVSPGLSFADYGASGIGNAVGLLTTGQDAYTTFAKDSGGSFYSAFMVNVSAAQSGGDYFYALSPAESQTSYFGRFFIKSSGAGFVVGISKSNETAIYGSTEFSFGTTYLAVVKYTFDAAKDSNDFLTVYVLPPATSLTSEPLSAEIVDTVTSKGDAKNFRYVTLRQGGASSSPTLTIDGIIVAKSWNALLAQKVFSIGTGNVPNEVEHYASLKEACDSINADSGAITGNRTYYITSNLTETSNVALGINTSGYTITFKPYTGTVDTITYTQSADNAGTSGAWVIGQASNGSGAPLIRTTNIVIDGSNTPGGTTRDLVFVSSTGTNAYPFRIKGDVDNSTIKNCVLYTSKTSIAYGIWINPTNASATDYIPDSLTIENCSITSQTATTGAGVYVSKSGTTVAPMENLLVKNNEIYAKHNGVYLGGLSNVATVDGNRIEVNQTNTGWSSAGINGVSIYSTGTTYVKNNKFTKLQTANTTAGAYGIRAVVASGGGTWIVTNNFISGFATAASGTAEVMGIRCGSTTKAYFNTIVVNDVTTTGSGTQAISGIVVAAGTPDIRNNIVVMEENDFPTYCIYGLPGISDNNNFYVADTTNAKIGYTGGAGRGSLAYWQSAALTDSHSVSGPPHFLSSTDLHIDPVVNPASVVSNAGIAIDGITTDIDGDVRNVSTPDIGADEYTANPFVIEPKFSATPASLNFALVRVNQSKQDSVVVKNTGNDTLHITDVSSTDAVFTVSPTSATLDSGATKTFVITFSPTAEGAKAASIVFTSDVSEGKDTVTVKGTGSNAMPIADVRVDANADFIADRSVTHDTVMVAGVVTTPNLQTTGTSHFIQDATGGIDIFSFNPMTSTIAIGDSVIAIGTVSQYRGLVEVILLAADDAHFTVIKHNAAAPAVKKLSIHEFATNAESYEGQYVQVDTLFLATGTWPSPGSYANLFLTNQAKSDTIQLFIDNDTPVDEMAEPTYPISLAGVVSQYSSSSSVYNNGYEIVPRDSNDIKHITVLGVNEYSGIPKTYELFNNYPNPFNPSTTIMYALPNQSRVEVKVYSILGQEVRTLVNDVQNPSYYRVIWNGTNDLGRQVSTGVYFIRISATASDNSGKKFVEVKKMMLMK